MTEIAICGVGGRMGLALLSVLRQESSRWRLSGAVESASSCWKGKDVGEIDGKGTMGVMVSTRVEDLPPTCRALIDFSTPAASLEHLRAAVHRRLPLVIGTTGFSVDEHLRMQIDAPKIPCVISSNMSLAMNVLLDVVERTSKSLRDFDAEIVETHHRHKPDAPSGTAKSLVEAIKRGRGGIGPVIHGREGSVGARPVGSVGVHAVRGGDIVGDHTVLFAGAFERVEITHRAHGREVFAQGALVAAEFVSKAAPGIYHMKDVLGL